MFVFLIEVTNGPLDISAKTPWWFKEYNQHCCCQLLGDKAKIDIHSSGYCFV